MKVLAVVVILALCACERGPTPEDVAGTYDAYSQNGEVGEMPEGYEFSIELTPDGIWVQTWIMEGHDSRDTIRFSVTQGEEGCIELLPFDLPDYVDEGEMELVEISVCGDSLIGVEETIPRTVVFLKRR